MPQDKLLRILTELAKQGLNSSKVYPLATDAALLAFKEDKPLFNLEEKKKVASLLQKSLPLLEKAFVRLHGSMNPDLRQDAQMIRSGLQFLLDEFKEDSDIYDKLKPIITSSGVTCVEESIINFSEIPPEYTVPIKPDFSKIPKSHYWWFQSNNDE